ncbi:MAG: ABC transporter ATP-binding protein [Rickettsiales bacterium]|jgi:lipoprotein-releasing system ATP-binding protein|nr:ABC transporter ATP-binding protein [Rickettsiales bacterium]
MNKPSQHFSKAIDKNPILYLQDICKTFISGDGKLTVLNGVNIQAFAGESVALIGPSGSGKSTLLHIAGLLDKGTSGKIFIDRTNYNETTDAKKDFAHKNKIGFIYQSNNLMNDFTAIENVMMPLMIQGVSYTVAKSRASELLKKMQLSDRENHYPTQLSGGQQQRIAIARAIITEPVILFADEPTGNLDPATSEFVFTQLISIVKEKNLCLIIATHNPIIARSCDKIFMMLGGSAIEVNAENKKQLASNKDSKELMKHFY